MFGKHLYLTLIIMLATLAGNAHALIVVSSPQTWGATNMSQDIQVVSGGSLTVSPTFSHRLLN